MFIPLILDTVFTCESLAGRHVISFGWFISNSLDIDEIKLILALKPLTAAGLAWTFRILWTSNVERPWIA
jgi:hypothetical protein